MWDRTKTQIKIQLTLIRHGETLSNREKRYLGKTEEALSEEGIHALRQSVAAGNYPAADLLFSGPMVRCLETARILYPKRDPICIPEWTEMDFGAFEGHNYQELSGDPGYQKWIDSGGTEPFPEGESREGFIARTLRGYDKMLAMLHRKLTTDGDFETSGQRLCVSAVVHGGTIMALLSSLAGGGYFDYQVTCGQGYCVSLVFAEGAEAPEWKAVHPLTELTKGETW